MNKKKENIKTTKKIQNDFFSSIRNNLSFIKSIDRLEKIKLKNKRKN